MEFERVTGSVYADKVQEEATTTLGKAEAPTVTHSSEPCSKSNSTMGEAAKELGATDGDCTETKSEQERVFVHSSDYMFNLEVAFFVGNHITLLS